MRKGKLLSVRSCPWVDHTNGQASCLTRQCAEHGPLYRIPKTQAAAICATLRHALDHGWLIPGDRMPLSLDHEGLERLCPRAFVDPVSELLLRDVDGPKLDLLIDDNIAYVEVFPHKGAGRKRNRLSR